jgi:hypothetical protein
MAKIYYKRIKAGIMTLEEVPSKWKNEVKSMLSSELSQEGNK